MNRRNRSHQDMASESASEDAPSPAKAHHGGAEGESQNHTKATKRSCNNCRQQKLRCDVIQEPFTACSRCRRLGKTCSVDREFKRVGKRDKYAKMQNEINDLRKKLELAQRSNASVTNQSFETGPALALRHNSSSDTKSRQLGEVTVSEAILDDLFDRFFTYYHPSLPFLDPQSRPDHYFETCPFLGWSIVMVAARRFEPDPNLLKSLTEDYVKLIWPTLATTPQPYHVAKALCLLCFWPIPSSTNLKDHTYQLTGWMMQIAMQNMLHLPFHNQETLEGTLPQSEQRDRILAWVACNIVAESASCVYGLPPQTSYKWVLTSDFLHLQPYNIPKDLMDQLRISRFCNTVTETLYCDGSEPGGVIPSSERTLVLDQLHNEYSELERELGPETSTINQLHLLAANVHLNCFAFFPPHRSPNRDAGFLNLYNATCAFLQKVLDCETSTGTLLEYCNNLISPSIFSSIFALLKLLNSPFTNKVNTEHGKALFNGVLLAAKTMSIQDGDVASRIASNIPKQWRAWGAGAPWDMSKPDPLVLKIQFRMSVSHGYDCRWSWREYLQGQGRNKVPEIKEGTSDVLTAPALSGEGSYEDIPLPMDPMIPGFGMEDLDSFASMDWMLGGWTNEPIIPYDPNSQNFMS